LDDEPVSAKPPRISAKAAVLVDPDTGQILLEKRANARRAVASLTKLMTALVIADRAKPREWVTVSEEASPPKNLEGISALGLLAGERIRVEELLYALLMQSANDAAVALAEHESGSSEAFEKVMNKEAADLGAHDTRFLSPNGLDDRGYSTAADMALIASAAVETPELSKIMTTKFHEVPAPPGGKPRQIQNRNVMLWLYPGTSGGKTGFTSKAGYCVIVSAERKGMPLLAVILGEKGEAFSEAAELLDWGFGNLKEVTPVSEGDPLGTRDIAGSQVELVAGETLTALVPEKERGDVSVAARVTRVQGPPRSGDVIGVVNVTSPSAPLGQVPLLAGGVTTVESSAAPTPSDADDDAPWWLRLLRGIWDAITGFFQRLFGD
jgi:D-alanyl-D-alanine carboxypeptidase (penicillin-binding protein 5/6)